MIVRACRGRRLTAKVQRKVCSALNGASGKEFALSDLFTY